MKIKTTLFLILLSFGLFAQDFQGTVKYEITYEDLPEQMKAMVGMMPSESILTYRDNMSRTETPNPAAGGGTVLIANNETGEVIVLQDAMGQKIAIVPDKDVEAEETDEEINFEDTGEEKEIAGYKCKVLSAEVEGIVQTVCVTRELPTIQMRNVSGIEGFPLEVINEMDQFTMIQTVKEIEEGKVKKIKMEVPSDYKQMTQKEIREMMQGGGGM